MNADQTITLSEAVSAQPSGIVLVWSHYNGSSADDYEFRSFFVPKTMVSKFGGYGFTFASPMLNGPMVKYLYLSNTSIKGFSENAENKQLSGGIYTYNTSWVLRYVIGV